MSQIKSKNSIESVRAEAGFEPTAGEDLTSLTGNATEWQSGQEIEYNDQTRSIIDQAMKDIGADPDLIKPGAHIKLHVGYIKNKHKEIEYTKPLLSVTNSLEALELEHLQAAPAKISPSRSKTVQKQHKDIFVWSDPQIDYRRIDIGDYNLSLVPIHDERAMNVARQIAAFIKPTVIVN